MRRLRKVLAWLLILLVLPPVVLVGGLLVFANTDPGRHEIEHLADSLTGGMVRLQGLTGAFPQALHVGRIEVADAKGVYVTIDDAVLDWSPLRLLHRVADIDSLTARTITLSRLPESSQSSSQSQTSFKLPVRVELHRLHVARLEVGAAVAGHPADLTLDGSGTLDSLEQGTVRLVADRLDGAGHYAVDAALAPDHIQANAQVREPPHGLIASIANLTDVGAIAIDAKVDGPKTALATTVSVKADPLTAAVDGTVNLTGESADLTVRADAPAMTPRPGVDWQSVHIDAKVTGPFDQPNATGTIHIAGLHAAGASIGSLAADLSGNAGAVHLTARVQDVTVPGPRPDLLAGAPILIDATAQLDVPDRPVTLRVQHPLLSLDATARTEGAMQAQAHILLPDLAPFAAAAGQDLQGHADLTLHAAQPVSGTDSITLQGSLGITGGKAPVPALVGQDAHIDLAAERHGQDITLSRLAVDAKGVNLSAQGGLTGGRIQLDWAAALTDLAAVRPDLSGRISAKGTATGPQDDLAVTADVTGDVAGQGYRSGTITAHLAAQGLPNAPSASLTAQGTLLDSPLHLSLTADRRNGVLQVAIDKADWKSLHAAGGLTLTPPATVPTGTLSLSMTRLADLQPLLGEPIAGSVTADLSADPQTARVKVVVQGVAVPGAASVAKGTVEATISGPADANPVIDGTATLDGVAVHGTTAALRLAAKGPADALALRLNATADGLMGAPAKLDSAATLDASGRTLDLTALRADWKQQALRLLAPARIGFRQGVSIGDLRLGLGKAVLAVSGHTGPDLALNASLRGLPAGIAAVVDPALAVDGSIDAEAHLAGTTAAPTGTVRLAAQGIRLRDGVAQGLPAANLTANVRLEGSTAAVDTRLVAGRSRLTVTGTAPLGKTGALGLRTDGTLDLVMLNPILASEGRRVRGTVTLAATVGGSLSAPRVDGTARLAGGDVQDVTLGVHLTDLAATVQAAGDTIRLTRLTGKAGPGTMGATGTIGLTGDKPIDLHLTADNARPVSSDILTAWIDLDMTVRGTLDGDLTVGGRLHVRRADIQVPEKMPASVAVLPVRVAGAPPPPPKPPSSAAPPRDIRLDLTLDAPQQVFVRGRGLDAELGGTIHIAGTAAKPLPNGGLHLRRGTFSLAGQTLTFTEGTFDFTGAGITDPSLHLVATSTTPTLVATLTVSGSARDPKITLSSVPQVPQDEILAQLLFQTTTAKLSPFQIAEIASALASLTGAPSAVADPLAGVRSALGLDRLSVGSNAQGSPTLQAGRYVARGVYVGAQQSAGGGGTQATVQVDLAKGLKLQTTAGNATTTATGATGSGDAASVGLTYQFEY